MSRRLHTMMLVAATLLLFVASAQAVSSAQEPPSHTRSPSQIYLSRAEAPRFFLQAFVIFLQPFFFFSDPCGADTRS